MNIKTEFNLNQVVFYMDNNRILSSRVDRIETNAKYNGLTTSPWIHISYTVMNTEGERMTLAETNVFRSRGDILICLEIEAWDLSECNYPQ